MISSSKLSTCEDIQKHVSRLIFTEGGGKDVIINRQWYTTNDYWKTDGTTNPKILWSNLQHSCFHHYNDWLHVHINYSQKLMDKMFKRWECNLTKMNTWKLHVSQLYLLTSDALFLSGLMTAMGLSGCPIRWLDANAATACWLMAFSVGWLALLTTAAKSPAPGEPCVLRYSLSCLFCFCAIK